MRYMTIYMEVHQSRAFVSNRPYNDGDAIFKAMEEPTQKGRLRDMKCAFILGQSITYPSTMHAKSIPR